MNTRAQQSWRDRAAVQDGVLARYQALDGGMSPDVLRQHVRAGRWRRVHPGVYVTFTGPLPFRTRVWAALLHAGPRALASHRTAGHLQGLVDEAPGVVDVSVPWDHRVAPQPGVRIHRRRHQDARRHPARSLPQTRVSDTVLDLVEQSAREDDVVGWLARGCQRRLCTPAHLLDAASRRPRLRHRRLVASVLADVGVGVHSPLERHYRRRVELAHGLPSATRNRAQVLRGRRWYHDVRYGRWRLRVELEGLAHHPDAQAWRDDVRDNAAVLSGDTVLRYGWRAVVGSPCGTANDVAGALRERGWLGTPRRCGPSCTFGATARHP
ncbi:MAG: hypothetical protein ABIV05_05645 [Actinomycetota bacterium]